MDIGLDTKQQHWIINLVLCQKDI